MHTCLPQKMKYYAEDFFVYKKGLEHVSTCRGWRWFRFTLRKKVPCFKSGVHEHWYSPKTDRLFSTWVHFSGFSLFLLFFLLLNSFSSLTCFAFLVCLRTVYKGEVCIHTIIPRNLFIECFGIRSFFHIDLSRSNQSGVPINLWYDTNKHASCWLFINLHNRCFLMKIPHCPPGPKASYTLRGDRKD